LKPIVIVPVTHTTDRVMRGGSGTPHHQRAQSSRGVRYVTIGSDILPIDPGAIHPHALPL
jgi:hypothetical protein